MSNAQAKAAAARNVALYPWFKGAQSLIFWQAVWFLYFQQSLSPAAAIALYAVYDISVTLLEVPSGYFSDRLGRRRTLIAATLAAVAGSLLLALGDSFAVFALGQFFLGAGSAFASGTDSALLYESLAADDRADEVEAQETRALQFSLSGFALSALTGGAIALVSLPATFWAAAVAMGVSTWIALQFTEPHIKSSRRDEGGQWTAMRSALGKPVLRWIFALSVMMYGFSHLPFVFGQPFISAALGAIGYGEEAPLASGVVSAVMMGLSVVASLFALRLRDALGLTGILLLAFGMQIALIGVLTLTQSWLAIAVLFFRIVPDALSHPFKMGRIQPLLEDSARATYVSFQSLCGKLVFAGSLLLAATSAQDVALMPYADIRSILGWYVAAGVLVWTTLALTARRAGVAR
jgi:MFS family permease